MKSRALAICLLSAVLLSLAGCGGHEHIYSARVVKAAYRRSEATCTAPAYYFHSCSCGEKGSTLFKHGAALGHSFAEDGICATCGIFEDEGLLLVLDKEENTYTVAKYDGERRDVIIPATYLGLPVTAVSGSAFWNCAEMESISFPASVTAIPVSAFYRAAALKRITVAEANPVYYTEGNCLVERESGRLILGCSGSALPESGITAIGSAAFKATGIEAVTVPEGVLCIEDDAFAACTSLSWIVLPSTLTAIDRWAFDNCPALAAVYYRGTAEEWETLDISSDNTALTDATLYFYSETAPDTEGNFWRYVDGVPTPW